MKRFLHWLLGHELHAYSDDCDIVIAYSLRDAERVMREDQSVDCLDLELWEMVNDGDEIPIHCDKDGFPTEPESDDDTGVLSLPASEWARRCGRGFLCTTEC